MWFNNPRDKEVFQIEVFKLLNENKNIDRTIFSRKIIELKVTLVKDHCRLDIRKYLFSQRTINERNKLSTDCINASRVNMFRNKFETHIRRAGYTQMKKCWTLDKPMASLCTCHLGLCIGW